MKKLTIRLFCIGLCSIIFFTSCENKNSNSSTSNGEYVDLGLSSGTKWKKQNDLNPQDPKNGFYTYDEAMRTFGNQLPSKAQWIELVNECIWVWTVWVIE